MLLLARNLGKTYGKEVIFKEATLQIDTGQSLAVIGPSGSGKSTLLSILGLLLQPTAGEIWYNDDNTITMKEEKRDHLRNRDFGFIFQSASLIGSLTVLDNIMVPAHLAKKKHMKDKAIGLLQEFELGHRLDYYPNELSLGQKRRAAIARAMLLDPTVVFADEPTNDLDPELSAWVGDYLFSLPKKGCSLIIVTHDRELAARADKIVAINNGYLKEK